LVSIWFSLEVVAGSRIEALLRAKAKENVTSKKAAPAPLEVRMKKLQIRVSGSKGRSVGWVKIHHQIEHTVTVTILSPSAHAFTPESFL
jgi:hypothetical protein